MTVNEAYKAFRKEIPEMVAVGYWRNGSGYIFYAKVPKFNKSQQVPPLYIVEANGKVYGTNPVRTHVDMKTMTKLKPADIS